VVNTITNLVREANRKTRKPSITQKMINTTDERRKWKNVNEGRENYIRMRNQMKSATDKTNKEYIEKVYDEIMELEEQDVMI
jgi:hypothetical protein